MKLKSICKVLGVVAAIALTGCGSTNAGESQSAGTTTTAQTSAAKSSAESSEQTSAQESKGPFSGKCICGGITEERDG